MSDRLGELLSENDVLYGLICRDATLTDVELMAQEGYHIVWLDLEHGPQSVEEAIRLSRTISHLGMVPLVRIVDLSRTHVQRLLDGGVRVLTLPDVRNGAEAVEFARLGKYPPVGERGVSSTSGGTDFALKPDVQQALRDANDSTHLMVMLEGDEGLSNLVDILAVQAVDMVTVGPMDWAVGLGVFGAEAQARMAPKIEAVLTAAAIAVAYSPSRLRASHSRSMAWLVPEDSLIIFPVFSSLTVHYKGGVLWPAAPCIRIFLKQWQQR